jgi:hypothetical protein
VSIPTQSNTSGHLCCCAREDSSRAPHNPSHRSPHRRHRRRHRRLLHRLPPREARLDRHGAAGEAQAHLRLDLPRRRPGRPAAHQRQHHPAARQLGRALQDPGGRDRPGHRLEDERRPAPRVQRGALDRGQAPGHHGQELRAGDAPALAEGGAGPVAADGDRRRGRRRLPARPTARPTPATSRWRSPAAPACTARPSARTPRCCASRWNGRRRSRRRHRRTDGSEGRIECEKVVVCGGQWTRALCATVGVNVPLVLGGAPVRDHRAVHTRGAARPADAARPRPPHLLQGGGRRAGDGRLRAEPDPVGGRRHPAPFQFQLLDSDFDHFAPIMELAIGRVPQLADTGIRS